MPNLTRSLVAFVMIAGATACHDTASPPTGRIDSPREAARALPQPAHTRAVAPPLLRRVTAAEFHAQNRMDWVGIAHNRVLDSLRAEIRAHRPRQLCRVIADIASGQKIDPRHTRGLDRDRVRRYLSAGAGSVQCETGSLRTSTSGSLSYFVAFGASSIGEEYDLSAEAIGLVDEIGGAVDGAASSAELAGALGSISAAAQVLSADDAAAVDAVASVAQSSFEYWEQNGSAAAQDFGTAYGDCISTANTLADCMGYYVSAPRSRDPGVLVWSASLMSGRAEECAFGWKDVAKADFGGAYAGLLAGAKWTRTIQGAILGALGGAAVASSSSFIWETGSYLWCVYHR